MRVFLWVIFCHFTVAASAAELADRFSGLGHLVVTQFLTAPFPHTSRTNGHTYQEVHYSVADHYSDSTVALFVPSGFVAGPNADFVVHFHGWRNTVAGTLNQYQLVEQLCASRRNAILIVPEGPHDAPDSGGGKLEDPDGFRRFMTEALTTLQGRGLLPTNASVGRIILSGHSGGYQVISSIVTQGGLSAHVREVWLFDALYARGEKFLAWAKADRGRLLNIYTDGGGTKTRTEEMMATLRERGQQFLLSTAQAVSPAALRTNQFVFLHTDLRHNEVVATRKTFQQFLEASCLAALPEDNQTGPGQADPAK